MCRAFRFALPGSLLLAFLALPLAAAETPAPAAHAASALAAASPLAGAIDRTIICTQSAQQPCPCQPDYSRCSSHYDSISYISQKPNGKCVYLCYETKTCSDANFCGGPPEVTQSTFRVRIGPYPVNACPAPDTSFCGTGEPDV